MVVFPNAFSHQLQNPDGRVVIVHDFALGGLADEFFVSRSDQRAGGMDNVPLSRGCQRNLAAPLQPLNPVERQAASILQQADHTGNRMVVLVVADASGNRCRKQFAAQMAAQLLPAIDGRVQGSLANEANQHTGWLLIKRSLSAVRTGVARRMFRMPDVYLIGTGIIFGSIPAMTGPRL